MHTHTHGTYPLSSCQASELCCVRITNYRKSGEYIYMFMSINI